MNVKMNEFLIHGTKISGLLRQRKEPAGCGQLFPTIAFIPVNYFFCVCSRCQLGDLYRL
jgi:hypothetical protein